MSSPPKCLWIGRQTKVNALVGNNDKTPVKITIILSLLMFLPHFFTTAKLFQNTRGSRGKKNTIFYEEKKNLVGT